MRLVNTNHLAQYCGWSYCEYTPVMVLEKKDKDYLLSEESKEINSGVDKKFTIALDIVAGFPGFYEDSDEVDYIYYFLPKIRDMRDILQLIMVSAIKNDIGYIHDISKVFDNYIALKYHDDEYNFLNKFKNVMQGYIKSKNRAVFTFKGEDLYAKLGL